jgi:hypothetical protein
MDPVIWGPHAWIFLHSITYNYPDNPTTNEINNNYDFFTALQDILPCNKCRYHYKKNLEKFPLTSEVLSSKQNLIKWLFKIHNNINKMNGKPEITFSEMNNIYNNLYSQKNVPDNNNDYIYKLALLILFLSIIFIVKITR